MRRRQNSHSDQSGIPQCNEVGSHGALNRYAFFCLEAIFRMFTG